MERKITISREDQMAAIRKGVKDAVLEIATAQHGYERYCRDRLLDAVKDGVKAGTIHVMTEEAAAWQRMMDHA